LGYEVTSLNLGQVWSAFCIFSLHKLTHRTSQSKECSDWCCPTSPVVRHHWAAELVGQSLSKDLLDWLVRRVSLCSERNLAEFC
jgi:hypothetical protein